MHLHLFQWHPCDWGTSLCWNRGGFVTFIIEPTPHWYSSSSFSLWTLLFLDGVNLLFFRRMVELLYHFNFTVHLYLVPGTPLHSPCILEPLQRPYIFSLTWFAFAPDVLGHWVPPLYWILVDERPSQLKSEPTSPFVLFFHFSFWMGLTFSFCEDGGTALPFQLENPTNLCC